MAPFAVREMWIVLYLWFGLCIPITLAYQPPERPLIPDRVPAILENGSVKPDAFYLRDSNGNPIYVPRQRYEDFERHQREIMSLENIEIPEFALEQMQASVAIESDIAKVRWKATLRPLDKDVKVIRCRIGLKDQNIYGPMTAFGGQVNFMRPLPEGGYEWWIQPDSSPNYSIEFQTTTRVTSSGTGNSLRFDLPNAPTDIQFAVPNREQDVMVAGVGVPTVEWDGSNPNVAHIRSTGGMQVLSWRSKTDSSTLDALEVESLTRLSLNQLNQVWTGTTRLEFRASGRKATREIQIQLPSGMHWLPSTTSTLDSNFSISLVPQDPARSDPSETLQLRILDTSSEKNEVSFAWDWTVPNTANGSFVFRGPKLNGVQRHVGKLEIDTTEDQRLRWDNSPLLQFSQQERLSDATRSIRSSFRFANQDFELAGNVAQAVTTTRLRPRFLVRVEPHQTTLTGFIEFASELSQLADVRLRVGAWQIQSLELDGRNISTDEAEKELGLPLGEWVLQANAITNASTPSGLPTHGLKITASLPWSCDDSSTLALQLPDVSFVSNNGVDRVIDHGTGFFVLAYPSNLQVADTSIQATGLIGDARSNPAIEELVGNQSLANTLSYRFTSESGPLTWTGHWQRLHRRILLRQRTMVSVERQNLGLQQTFECETLHESLDRLRVLVPRTMLTGIALGQDQLEFRIDGKAIDWVAVQDESRWQDAPATHPSSEWEVVELLTKSFSNRFRLEILTRQSQAWPTTEPTLNRFVDLPLPLWVSSAEYLEHIASLRSDIDIDVEIPDVFLKSKHAPFSRLRELILPPGISNFPISFRQVTTLPRPSVQIQRAFLHSAINAKDIRHRFVFQFTCSAPELLLRLPEEVGEPAPEFLLDGTRVSGLLREGIYSISLPASSDGQTHVCEVWVWQKRLRGWTERVIGWMPEIVDSSLGSPMLWQVTVPQGDTVIASESGLAPEYLWDWSWTGLQRRSSWQQSQLESWVSGSHQPEIGSQANQIVLSLSSIASPSIWLSSRTWIAVPSLLIFGLLGWFWVSMARARIGIFLMVVCTCLVLMMLSIDLAIVVAQTSLFALFIVMVTQSLTWLLVRPSNRSIYGRSVPMVWGTSNSKVSIASTQAAEPVLQPSMEASE